MLILVDLKILMLTWEYPPRIVGGLSRHVYWLSKFLVEKGVDVIVITLSEGDYEKYEVVNNVKVIRINPYLTPSMDFLGWVHQFNDTMIEKAVSIREYDLIHAHDWLVAPAAIILKHLKRLPLIATIHSTEYGRRNGIHNEFERHIHEIEWFLTYEAWRVIVCSNYMRNEVIQVFNTPWDKVDVIPNGVNPIEPVDQSQINEVSRRYGIPLGKPIILFVGRLVYEKGAHILVETIPRVVSETHGNVFYVFVGEGPMRPFLEEQVKRLGVQQYAKFTGFVDEITLKTFYNMAYIAVFPSLYEPFGIVALEAMSIGKPVIVSDTGGLAEIVEHLKTGIKVPPGNVYELGNAILRLIYDKSLARYLGENARKIVYEKYTWDKIADNTIKVYENVLSEYNNSSWKPSIVG